ncbi:N-acetyltransferase 16, like [Alosa pseudoharengus]|uniref:N-acetyltransferase 16, like n=1 Tax=Alosa pseudoharengus TaxID=34774 RepID=UPI003F88C2A0
MEPGYVGENDGLTFWLARPEDYDDVMSISQDIYRGNDYLPHRYHEWMDEPDRVVILARRAGKLVALESGIVVDDGQTVVVEGLRVCPSERGHGVAGVIQAFADSYMKKLYPSIKVKHLTRGDDPGPEKLSKFRLLARRAILSLSGETESFDGFISALKAKLMSNEGAGGSDGTHLALETEQQLRTILLEPDIVSRLQLPGGAIIQDWQPLQPIESNLAVLRRRNLAWFVGGPPEKPAFVSFYTPPYPVTFNGGALRLNIDLYGTDQGLACGALLANLEKVRAKLRGTVAMHVYMHGSLYESLRTFCQTETGVQECWEKWEQLFLERDL